MLTPEQINDKYPYGTKLVRKRPVPGKETVVYVVTHNAGYDIVVKLSPVFPYAHGMDLPHYFVHVMDLQKYHHVDEGIQLEITI